MSFQSRGGDPQRLLPETLEDRILGMLAQGAGVLLCLMGAAGWISLLTWTVSDPSLTHATGGAARNLLGNYGAMLSDLLLQTLGFAAVFVLLPPVIWGLELVLAGRIPDFRSKICLFPLAVVLLAGACSALPIPARWPLHHGLGGILGDALFTMLNNVFGVINPERGGLAAGLVFASTGLGAMIQNLGLSGRDFVFLMQPEAGDDRSAKPDWRRWLDTAGAIVAKRPMPQAAIPTANDLRHYVPTPRYQPAGPRQQQGYAEEAFTGFLHAPGHEDLRYGNSFDAAVEATPEQSRRAAAINRGPAFDSHTEAASREIAERFAPPAYGVENVAAGGSGGLLGGFWNRRQPPAYKRPSLNLLKRPAHAKPGPEFTSAVLRGTARLLEDVLADFGIKGEVKDIKPGPVVTLYELEPARGTKAARIMALADDIARSMSATAVRVAIVPGRNVIGIELPNVRRETVLLREILEADSYRASEATLPLALGRTISGDPVVTDLARMPHLLVAGTTGSGKSVGVNAMILSLIYKLSPDECRFLMIDPKMLELSVYNGIPHLLTPVITDAGKAIQALNWAVGEMEERYKRMSQLSVRNIDVFNNRVRNAAKRGEQLARTVQTGIDARTGQPIMQQDILELEAMPYIVIVVDEFADLMISAGKEIEIAVQRLAQMARAAGIHLIMATQRPSVDIITGTIKANFPTRLSFKVASRIDSRTILNEQGAEQLLGQGDMLLSTGAGQSTRIHGPFVSDEEVEGIVAALRAGGEPRYLDILSEEADPPLAAQPAGRTDGDDDLYNKAVAIVLRDRKASTSYLQRRLAIGYNRAADLIERMERDGIITPAAGSARRDVLVENGPRHASDAA
jgi:DNA segregation ATPase FtsK/SpoIIIE, S-DNA-T family